ncbi:MAG: two-component regulator propeller domain-containing protein [Parabacteroides sp.]
MYVSCFQKNKILTLILLIGWAMTLSGKVTEFSLPFRKISAEHGLPHNEVSALYKDVEGFLWIGTKEGLSRFDGNQLIDYSSTVGDDIWSIQALNDDTLLVATLSGIKWFDKISQTTGLVEEVPQIWFSSLCRMDSTAILAGSEQGLYLIRQHEAHRIPIDNMLASSNQITGIIPDETGDGFWFSTADGLGHIDSRLTPTMFRRVSEGNRDNYFTCLAAAKGAIYVGSYHKGAFRFDKDTQSFTPIDTDHANLIMRMDADSDHVYIGTNGRGLMILDLNNGEISCAVHKNSNPFSIASNVVTALLNDESAIYVGAQFGGISYHSKVESQFSFYRIPHFYSTAYNARSLYFYPDGEMLLGTRSGIFQLRDKRLIHALETSDFDGNLRSGIILYIGDAYGKVLVCSYGGGVSVYDRTTGRLHPFNEHEEYAQYGRIFHFVTDRQGHIWFASHEGIYETDAKGNLLRHISSANSTMRNDAAYWLAFDSADRLWIATKFGLRLLDPSTGKMAGPLSSIPAEMDVRYIYRDSHDDMWICGNRGVYCINGKLELVRMFDNTNLLPENIVTSVIEVPKDLIRLSTLHHIVYYDLNTGQSEIYRSSDGIGLADFNGTVAVSPDAQTVFWTNEGGLLYTSLSASSDRSEQESYPQVTSVQVGDRVIPFFPNRMEQIRLTEGESVHFNLSHLDFRFPENECFEYQLAGKDEAWQLLSGQCELFYPALSPGRYTLKVRNPGQETCMETSIIVKRQSWKTVLFWVGILLVFWMIVAVICWIKALYRRIAERTQLFSTLHKHANKPVVTSVADVADGGPSVNPLMGKLLALVEDQQIYLDPKLKIGQVAQMLDCKESELSRFLNAELSTNFTSFINTYRVKAIKKAMADGDLKRYTVTAIGLRCGYNSKMTFFRAFKAIEGKTPLEYCKEMGYTMKTEE